VLRKGMMDFKSGVYCDLTLMRGLFYLFYAALQW
jgi:hypothetical protein